MSFLRTPAALAVALALPTAGLYGTDSHAADDRTRLPAVTVSGTLDGTPPLGAVTLDAAALAARRAATSDTARLITDLPGVDAYGAGGVSSLPVIRGLAVGTAPLAEVVIRGAASALASTPVSGVKNMLAFFS